MYYEDLEFTGRPYLWFQTGCRLRAGLHRGVQDGCGHRVHHFSGHHIVGPGDRFAGMAWPDYLPVTSRYHAESLLRQINDDEPWVTIALQPDPGTSTYFQILGTPWVWHSELAPPLRFLVV